MRIYCASLLALLFLFTTTTKADLVLSFSSVETNIAVGQTFSIDIIVTQTDNGDLIDGGDIREGADGLFEAGLLLESSSPAVASSEFLSAGSGFEDSIITPSNDTELYVSSIDPNVPTFAPNTDPTSLTLGTFSFTGLAAGTTQLTFADPSDFDDWVFGNDLGGNDAAVFAGAQPLLINVSAVPEPSSLILFGGVTVAFLVGRKRHV